jgi:ribosomal protein S6--L-glutamate ligase
VRIAFVLGRHQPEQKTPIVPTAMQVLRGWSDEVSEIFPGETVIELSELTVDHDLYVHKTRTPLSLSLMKALDHLGAAILPSIEITLRCRDKVVTTRILREAGIPLPETWIASTPRGLAELIDRGPIVVKPSTGSKGEGVMVVRDRAGLEGVRSSNGFIFAQRYHEPKDRDHKLYRIGQELFGVRRVWPSRTYEQKLGEPFEPNDELTEIAHRCGDAFGIDLYGIDVVVSEDGPLVVDFSAFPGFKGVPDAGFRLARYIRRAAERAVDGSGAAHGGVATGGAGQGHR